ncbi:MFS transporter [Corynebacterium hindlerae]|uniref:MFS transporter n=1 Tax=Corynebacterium hindlerae TaxID=699041 RepID=UPI0031B6E084
MDNERFNARRFVAANGLQSIGDQVVAAKTVLPYILHTAGAPAFFSAMLVPIRESGSMLPQAALTPWVVRHERRKMIWVWGSVIQGAAAAGIAVAALFTRGVLLGTLTVVLLGVLAGGRALCSIASKDVQGRTISKGSRGKVTGTATMAGGVSVVVIGAALLALGSTPPMFLLVSLIGASACAWLLAGVIFRSIKEPVPEIPERAPNNWLRDSLETLREDRDFRRFVVVRSLLLVSALSPTFLVMLAPSSLGAFLLASGVASIVGGRIAGVWSDRSSKDVMRFGAVSASVLLLGVLAADRWAGEAVNVWFIPLSFLMLHLIHTAVRVARKTYVVDMAEGEKRTRYVAIANSAMGVILLFAGVVSGGLSMLGPQAALLFLSALGVVGFVAARGLDDVSTGPRGA